MSIKQVININSLTNSKKTIKIKATEEDTIYLAKETGVVKFLSLEATVSITRSMNRFKVDGEIIADIIQEDAINLEEINTRLQLPIKRIYEIPVKIDSKKIKNTIINLDKEEEDIDTLEKDTIDIGFIILEELILNIDPFVRK